MSIQEEYSRNFITKSGHVFDIIPVTTLSEYFHSGRVISLTGLDNLRSTAVNLNRRSALLAEMIQV